MSELKPKLLIVDDDTEYLEALQRALSSDFDLVTATSFSEARESLTGDISIVLIDVRLREGQRDRDGLDLLEAIGQAYPGLPVVMMTAYADLDLAVDALRLGAMDFIQKARVDIREFRKVLDHVLERSSLRSRNENLERELRRLETWEMVGEDPKMEKVQEQIDDAARDSYCTVMIRGETGTGKELVARAIHSRGKRRDKPFVAVSLVSFAPELVPTELFGHAKGAFTDAREARAGYIEAARGGVLFLDEIGELPLDVQAKLLRVLETRSFARVGSTTDIHVDIQIVCATNKNLEQAIAQRQFREDLYYRLQGTVIWLPPLRERIEDIPLLVDHHLFDLRKNGRTKLKGISPQAIEQFKVRRYPGNVRELNDLVFAAARNAAANGHLLIEAADIPPEGAAGTRPVIVDDPIWDEDGINLEEILAETELKYIQLALQATEGKKTDAWRLLGLNDRYAMLRHVKRIANDYPQLLDRFSVVKSLYKMEKLLRD